MDEIFDRIKSTKIKQKYLASGLIFTEILGILTLVWYLKEPLYQKYLIKQSEAFSLNQMNPQTQYLFAQNDYLIGRSKPNQEVAVLISKGGQILDKLRIKADQNGQWSYQFPEDIDPGSKTLTTGDINNNLVENIQTYKIRIVPNERLEFIVSNPSQTILEQTISQSDQVKNIILDSKAPLKNNSQPSAPLMPPVIN